MRQSIKEKDLGRFSFIFPFSFRLKDKGCAKSYEIYNEESKKVIFVKQNNQREKTDGIICVQKGREKLKY